LGCTYTGTAVPGRGFFHKPKRQGKPGGGREWGTGGDGSLSRSLNPF